MVRMNDYDGDDSDFEVPIANFCLFDGELQFGMCGNDSPDGTLHSNLGVDRGSISNSDALLKTLKSRSDDAVPNFLMNTSIPMAGNQKTHAQLAQILFEGCSAEKVSFAEHLSTQLCASGRTTGECVVVSSGIITVGAFYEAWGLNNDNHLGTGCSYLVKEFGTKDVPCERGFPLPDGVVMLVDSTVEAVNQHLDGIRATKPNMHSDLLNNIVVGGPGSKVDDGSFGVGLKEKMAASQPDCKVIAPPERQISSWIGGSIIGSLSSCSALTKADYDEYGANAIRPDEAAGNENTGHSYYCMPGPCRERWAELEVSIKPETFFTGY